MITLPITKKVFSCCRMISLKFKNEKQSKGILRSIESNFFTSTLPGNLIRYGCQLNLYFFYRIRQ